MRIGTVGKQAAQQSWTVPSLGMVEVLEDRLLRDVFACTLDASQATSGGEASITHLQAVHEVTEAGFSHACLLLRTASRQRKRSHSVSFPCTLRQELREEQGLPAAPSAEAPPLRLKRDVMERVLMSRLTDPPAAYPQPPLAYLLGCYTRASAASRSLPSLSNKQALAQLQATLAAGKALVVSYAGLMLTMDMFPQVFAPSLHGRLRSTIIPNHLHQPHNISLLPSLH